MNEAASPIRYATFTRRFRALVIDSAIVTLAVAALAIVGEFSDRVPGSGRVVWMLMVGLLLLYEPILVSVRGATVGHAVNDLRVMREPTGRWPGFVRALTRFLVKIVFGIPSFITMPFTRRHQAVHDLLTKTTVQLTETADAALGDFHLERTDDPGIVLPSRRRRIAVIALYLVALIIVYDIALLLTDPAGCSGPQSCTSSQRAILGLAAIAWLGLSIATIPVGWKGLLFGGRRRGGTNTFVDEGSNS